MKNNDEYNNEYYDDWYEDSDEVGDLVVGQHISLYPPKLLPYHFILFCGNIPEDQFEFYKLLFKGGPEDNALLTYCYLDMQCGLSYKLICCAHIDDEGKVSFTANSDVQTGMTIREGGLQGNAIILSEGEGLEQFQKEADFIKECYGYNTDMVKMDECDPFDRFRHPFYESDILVYFTDCDDITEKMWVTEIGKGDSNEILGRLINEPHSKKMGVHEGDIVRVIALFYDSGKATPVAIMPWMVENHCDDLMLYAYKNKMSESQLMEMMAKAH